MRGILIMNNKVLVSVRVLVIEEEYDIYIPVFKNISSVLSLIMKTVNKLSLGHFPVSDKWVLLNEQGEVLDLNKNIKESNIKNGDKLYLV